ncbi:MAG: ABC transporter ATP-binding protein [Alphaproteobacteria bacterium]
MEVELRGITKRFGPVVANSDVNLTLRPGEILGLLGENGAGKTTLMNVLSGLYRADEGEIIIDGQPTRFDGPGDAITAGIGMVHQHFMLVPVFTVAENVVLGVEPTGAFDRLDLAVAHQQVTAISSEYGLEVDPEAVIEEISVGLQQRVEIIKVLFRSADVIVFDEPTAVLTPQEVTEFFGIIRSLRDAGKALVFITHKLHEVLEVADRISVLRGGEIVGEGDPKTSTDAELAELMVGRPVRFEVEKAAVKVGQPVLEVKGLQVLSERDEIAVNDVTFEVREGEVVGIAGVQGNGQTELVEAITGLRMPLAGSVTFLGKDITRASARQRHRAGIAHIPEDRQRSGIIGTFNIAENMVLDTYYDDRYSSGISMHWPAVYKSTAQIIRDFDVRATSVFSLANHLSGGNQQKLVVARELSRDIKMIIAAQPTRGVDVGSIEYIHQRIIESREEGDGILFVSTELDEVMGLSDRILVMFRGRIVAEFDGDKAGIQEIGLAMAGAVS